MTVETQAPPTTAPPETPAPWKCGDPTPRLNKSLSQLQGKMTRVKKTKEGEIKGVDKYNNPFSYKYQYADLGDVVADLGPFMAEFGLAFTAAATFDPQNRTMMVLDYGLVHESGEERGGQWPLGAANQPPQKLGSAITYARRYTFQALTNIVLEDDDDGQHAERTHDNRQSAGNAWDGASKERPQGNGRGDRQDGPKIDPVAQALAKLALQLASDTSKTVADLSEKVEKQAAGKGKLDAPVPNPFGDGLVKLRDVLREARARMEADPPGHGPAAEPGVGEQAEAIAEARDAEADGAADPQDPESVFVIAYYGKVAAATGDEQLTAMRPEIGVAVKDKIISPKVAGDLSAAVSARKRELAEAVTS
jgi:ERF superfamily